MGQRFHRGFTAAEKTELWDRWKRGESLKAIGRAFGKPSSSIYFLVAPHGGHSSCAAAYALGLLRSDGARPRRRRAAEKRDELAPSHVPPKDYASCNA